MLFEAPHRIRASLDDLRAVAGDRTVAVCRELTKMHEECVTGAVTEVLDRLQAPRGEFTVVVLPGERPPEAGRAARRIAKLAAEFGHLTASGLTRRASIRALATRYALPSREVYQAIETERSQGAQAIDPICVASGTVRPRRPTGPVGNLPRHDPEGRNGGVTETAAGPVPRDW